ncbi:MAG: hypothetical protein ABW123_20070 [Cystobacter sp.]
MPQSHLSHPLLAGMGLLALASFGVVVLAHVPPTRLPPPLENLGPLVLVGLALVSGGVWFLVGYALGGGLRAPPPPPPEPHRLPPALDLAGLSTEQLYRELERMNREALLYGPRLPHHVSPQDPTRQDPLSVSRV